MKTANLLSVTAFIALAGLMTNVGCSTPTVGAIDSSDAAETAGDDDDDTTTTKKKTKPAMSDDTNVAPTNTASDGADRTAERGGEACGTCLAANPKAVKFDECAVKCTTQACADDCKKSSGCSADAACTSTLTKCQATCEGAGDDDDTAPAGDDDDDTTGGEGDKCISCLGGTGPAVKFIACLDDKKCQDQKCEDSCFDQECGGNEQACQSKLKTCDAQCFQGGEQEQP